MNRTQKLAKVLRPAQQMHFSTSAARCSSTSNSNSKTTATTSSKTNPAKDHSATSSKHPNTPETDAEPKKKSILQQDEELRQKMSGLSGDGGDSGVEYEDGKPVSMKRSVKNNMFRYI